MPRVGFEPTISVFFLLAKTVHALDPPRSHSERQIFGQSGGPSSIPGTTRKKLLGLERGPLSLVSTIEELLDRKVAAPV
jgi:hypothetical protein